MVAKKGEGGDSQKQIYNQNKEIQIKQSVEFLTNWVNEFIGVKKVERFPEDLVNNKFEVFFEILEIIFKKVPKLKEKKQEASEIVLNFMEFLKQNGVLLNHVRPETLLNYFDYQTYMHGDLPIKGCFILPEDQFND